MRDRGKAGYADVFELRLFTAGGNYYAYLQVTDKGTFVGQEVLKPDGGTPNLTPVADLANGQSCHVDFETDFRSFSVSYEGEPSHKETMQISDGTAPQLALGLVFTEGGGPFDLLFDNLACDSSP